AGLHTHRRAIEAGDPQHGASVHYVSAEVDRGALISQIAIDVAPADTPTTLARRLLAHEHALLVASVGLVAEGRLKWCDQGPLLDGQRLLAPLQLKADGRMNRRAAMT
ncbi:MAG: formyltransferase family protein, partial [Dokdonella sp.]